MTPPTTTLQLDAADAAADAGRAAALEDRPGLLRLLQCRLWHRDAWQAAPVDTAPGLRCGRCERTWQAVGPITEGA